MTIYLTLNAPYQSTKKDSFLAFLKNNLPRVRSFDGCLSVTVFLNNDQHLIHIAEEWISQEHHQAYIKEITENNVMAELASFLVGQPEITYYQREVI